MKILHLGDLHLGRELADYSLIDDQRYILEQILQLAYEKKAELVLMAGDIYDKAIPSEKAVELLDWFLSELVKRGIKVCLISGNHDSDERLNFGSGIFRNSGLFIASKYEGVLTHETFGDEYGTVNVWLLPFVKASLAAHFFPQTQIDSYEKAVSVIIDKADVNSEERNIIVAHQFVTGDKGEVQLSGSEGIAAQTVGTVEKVSFHAFDKFDYVALGHIHSGQQTGRAEVRYSGSPLKYSLSEAYNDKSVPFITMGEKGNVSVELLPLKPMRDLRELKGHLSDLTKPENVTDCNDFIYATLTDEEPADNPVGILRQFYPNTVSVRYENSHTVETNEVDISDGDTKKSFSELISDFYLKIYGREISEEELELMKKLEEET